jgi:hypothetical protein
MRVVFAAAPSRRSVMIGGDGVDQLRQARGPDPSAWFMSGIQAPKASASCIV